MTLFVAQSLCSLTEAIQRSAPGLGAAVGLAYGVHSAWLERVGSDAKRSQHADPREEPYEYRMFSAEGELRWLRDPNAEHGRAVLLTEREDIATKLAPAPSKLEAARLPNGTTASRYMMWGTVVRVQNDWACLSEGRIGSYWAPVTATVGSGLVLTFLEYFAVDRQHGNARVVEERLIGIESGA